MTRTAALRGRKFHAEDDVQQAVTEGALTALKALKDTRDIKTGAVFLNKHGEPMSYSVWHARWDELRKACGLDHMHTHDVRAVHLTALFQVPGVNLADVMARAGHTDYRSAMRYQRPDVQRQKDLVQQLQL